MSSGIRFALAVGSGALGILAFPPFGVWPLAVVVWTALMFSCRGAGWRAAWLGLAHGLVFFGGSLSWLWNLFGPQAVGLWLLLALFTAGSAAAVGMVSRRWPHAAWLALFAALTFAVVDHFRAEWFVLRFPWMTPGLALGPTWMSPWIGVYGASFVVLLTGGFVAFGGRWQRSTGVAVAGALLVLGIFRPPPVEEPGEPVPLLAVQSENCDFQTYVNLTEKSGFTAGIVLWPEYAAPGLRHAPRDMNKALAITRERDATLILGTTWPIDRDRHYNEALTLEAGQEAGSHFKNHPVHLMDDGVAGTEAKPVTTRFGRIGTPICFDCDYEDTVRRMTAAGAEMFAVPSMDAVHWSRRQHLQHAELFRHRALENGRWMAVCATSGLTQVIDPHGNRVAELPLMDDRVLVTAIHPRSEMTFYTRIGWRLPQVLAGIWCGAMVVLVVAAIRSRKTRQVSPRSAAS